MLQQPFSSDLKQAILGRKSVRLPEGIPQVGGSPIRDVWVKPFEGEEHLDAGVLPLILSGKHEVTDKSELDAIEERINRVVLTCLVDPVPVHRKPKPGEVCVTDIPFKSRAKIMEEAVDLSASLFYGVDRTMDGNVDERLKHDQLEVCKFYYRCCSELGDKFSELGRMNEQELAKRLAILQAGDAMKARAERKRKSGGQASRSNRRPQRQRKRFSR